MNALDNIDILILICIHRGMSGVAMQKVLFLERKMIQIRMNRLKSLGYYTQTGVKKGIKRTLTEKGLRYVR